MGGAYDERIVCRGRGRPRSPAWAQSRSAAWALSVGLVASGGCRGRRSRTEGAPVPLAESVVGDAAAPGALGAVAPVRASDGSQPRWRYVSHGSRPRGVERWRFDLAPREALGEPATDGRTVFVAAAREDGESYIDGEVYAFDLRDGSLRWHTPVSGLHGEPVEFLEGTVVVDTIRHCLRRAADTPGVLQRACLETAAGGVVGLDPSTGQARFRTTVSSEAVRSGWTVVSTSRGWWMHDGTTALRGLVLPGGTPGARVSLGGTVLAVTGLRDDVLAVLDGRRGTELVRREPTALRSRWERAVPFRGRCPPVVSGGTVVLAGFASATVTGGPRALRADGGSDGWSSETAPQAVHGCGAVEGGVYYQPLDGALLGFAAQDGRRRARWPLRSAPTGSLATAMDGVFYLSMQGRLEGVDVVGGHTSVRVDTAARSVEGLVLWNGHGVAVTQQPGLVIGFD